MPQSPTRKAIPTQLTLAQFNEFVLPYLKMGSRGPQPKLDLYKIFNYILKLLDLGCQWKELPIEKDADGLPEIHYTSIYRAFRRFEAHLSALMPFLRALCCSFPGQAYSTPV